MDAIGDGGAKEENHTLRKLCIWKDPINGRSFLDYKIENGIFVPARSSRMKGDCFNQMMELVQKFNFERGGRVFHITDLRTMLPHYSHVQVQRTAKEHLKSKNGIFKVQKDVNGKITPATYVLKSLYVLDKDDKKDES